MAIAIPVFTTQLEKSREATDISNVRSAYAEAMAAYMANGASGEYTATASAKQMKSGWEGEAGNVVCRLNGVETKLTYDPVMSGGQYTVVVKNSSNGSTVVSVSPNSAVG